MAWRERYFRETAPLLKTLGRGRWVALNRKKTEETRKRIYRAHGLQTWKHYASSFAIFPVWLGVIEALRRMSGGPSGILGLIQQAWSGTRAVDVATPAATPAAAATGPDIEPPLASNSASIDGSTVLSTGSATPMPDAVVLPDALGFDPSLSTGGCLWFTDLTVADPIHVLPFMLSAVLLVNLTPSSMVQFKQLLNMTPTPAQQANPWPFRLRRALVILAMAVGPLTMNLPATIHLYWISSTTFSMALTKVVDHFKPIRAFQLDPCKRRPQHIIAHPPLPSKPPPATKVSRPNTRTAKKA
jgi:inner membrane protein COX18